MKNKYLINKLTIAIVAFIMCLQFVHNYAISELTRNRNFVYQSWNLILSSTDSFKSISTGDSIISSTSNDAFEENAGYIFAKTGKRLTYLFNAGILWPDLSQCAYLVCELKSPREVIMDTIPNITRNSGDINEWINKGNYLTAKKKTTIWYMDYIPLAAGEVVFFLAPFSDSDKSTTIDISKLEVISVNDGSFSYSPSIGGYCFNKVTKTMKYGKKLLVVHKNDFNSSFLDIRQLQLSSCGLLNA